MRIQNGTAILKTGWQLRKLIIYLPCDSAIAHFGISPEELKAHSSTKTCTQIFLAVLSIVAKTWSTMSLSVDKWINKLGSIQMMENYSTLKRGELSDCERTCRNLRWILLRERNQPEKPAYCLIPIIWHSRKGKTMEPIKDQWFPGVGVEGWIVWKGPEDIVSSENVR